MVSRNRPKAGTKVILTSIPPGLLDGLPLADQRAIEAIVGKPVALEDYDDVGRAELMFRDKRGDTHSIWVKPKFIRSAE